MNWKSTETTAAAADVREKARDLGLTAAEAKTLAAVRAKMSTAGKYHAAHWPPARAAQQGKTSPLQNRLDTAAEAFAAEPNDSTAAELERAAAAVATAEIVWGAYGAAESHLRIEAADRLRPVALALLERAEKALAVDFDTARQALAAAPGLAAELRSFEQRVERAFQVTAEQRQAATREPLEWLSQEVGI